MNNVHQQRPPQSQPAQEQPPPIRITSAGPEQAFFDVAIKGYLDVKGFADAVMKLGVPALDYYVWLTLFQKADSDESGHVQLEEFLEIVPRVLARAAFARADPHDKRHLDVDRFRKALESLGFNLLYTKVMEYYGRADQDKDYTVGFEEFDRILATIAHKEDATFESMLESFKKAVSGDTARDCGIAGVTEKQALAAFEWADSNSDGQLGLRKFVDALHRLGLKMDASHTHILKYFAKVDKNESGHIDKQEFLSIFRSAPVHVPDSQRLKSAMKSAGDIDSLD